MERETRRRVVWFAVFMVWIGVVASIVVNNERMDKLTASNLNTIQQSAPTDTQVSVENTTKEQGLLNNNISPNILANKDQQENNNKDLLVEYRVNRDKARSEQVTNYRDMVNNPNTDPSIKKHAQEEMLAMTKRIEQEMEIESLIRAAGFADAIAYLHENSIDLIVQSNGLTKSETAKIADIVIRVTDLRYEDMSIMESRYAEE